MSRRQRRYGQPSATKAGLAPGTLLYVGEVKTTEPLATLIEYGPEAIKQTRFSSIDEGQAFQPSLPVRWLNVHGLHNVDLLKAVGERFKLHPLVLEDILNTNQRPKVEDYGDYLFIVARLAAYDPESRSVVTEQLSIVLGRSWVLTFQEKATGAFREIRERLEAGNPQLRKSGADYLVYSLLDKVADRYFGVLESLGEAVEELEDSAYREADEVLQSEVHRLRREMLFLRRALWPLREVLNALQRDDAEFFAHETQIYLRDVYDHTVHLIESLETLRDLVSGLVELSLNSQSNRLNKQMRFLAALSATFMPLTLITGIYGMNFDNMPELKTHDGYFVVLGVMATLATGLVWFFSRRRWL